MRESAARVARKALSSPHGEIAELLVRSFEDDPVAHDDTLQKRLCADFAEAFENALTELSAEYGPPARVGENDDQAVPLCGVLRFAVWSVSGRELWLAASHEDRECPLLLLLGTTA